MMEPAGEVGWGHVEDSIHNYPMTDGDFSREGKVTSSDLSLTGKALVWSRNYQSWLHFRITWGALKNSDA